MNESHFKCLVYKFYNVSSAPAGIEASVDPPNVAIMITWSSCFMLTCRGITRHNDMKYVNKTNDNISRTGGRTDTQNFRRV